MNEALRILADAGLSRAQAAVVLGMPKGSVITRARIAGIWFEAHRKDEGLRLEALISKPALD